MKIASIDKAKLARTDDELRSLASSDDDWFVRSADDLMELRNAGDNVFAKLPRHDFLAFQESLKFESGGIAGGSYKPLMNNLTLPEIFDAFGHLGIGMELFLDDDSDSCLECKCDGGCSFSFWDFCSSLCGTTAAPE
jgi:hypothetical protein